MPNFLFATHQLGQARSHKHNGREYMIAPAVAIVEGVLQGEFVSAEEFGRTVAMWNGSPVPIGHPVRSGEYISANDPSIRNVGVFYNAHVEGNQLKGDIWFDIEAMRAAGPEGLEVLRRLTENQVMELSTAYWRDLEEKAGVFGAKQYSGIAHNLRPDHVAVLLEAQGACAVHDGCGTPRVNEEETSYCLCGEHVDNDADEDDETDDEGVTQPMLTTQAETNLAAAIFDRLRALFSNENGHKETRMTKEEMLAKLAGEDADFRAKLEDLDDELLAKLAANAADETDEEDVEELDEEEEDEGEDEGEDDADDETPDWAVSLIEKFDALNSVVDGLTAQAQADETEVKSQLISEITGNGVTAFTTNDLKVLSVDQLTKLARTTRPADFSGQGGLRAMHQVEEFEMPMPVIGSLGGDN